jgi:outer membrane receptor protein involved in Fe transport
MESASVRPPGIAHTQQYTLNDDVSYIAGNHAVKFGGTIFWGRLDRLAVANLRGQFLYQGTLSGSPMADFLLGIPSSTGQDAGGDIGHMGRQYYAAYLMDDWKLTPHLTLNIGIRYELYTVPLEANNRLSAYNIPLASIVVSSDSGQLPKGVLPQFFGATSPLPIVSSKTAGLPRGLTNTDSNNWAPRFSFAYRLPFHKSTVVRAGYGWFYSPVRMETRMSQAVNNAPFLARMYFLNDIRFPLLNSLQASAAMGKTTTGGGTLMMQGLEQNFQDLMSQQWNFTIERDLGWNSSARISYVGNRGTHLPVNLNLDQDYVVIDPVTKRPTLTRLDRRVNPINIQMSAARSWYQSVEAEFNRRFQKGISIQSSWTWGKNISDAETDVSMPQDSFCLRCDRADASYQRRHMAKLNFIYDLPNFHMNRALSHALNGWRLTGIGQLMTGVRYTPIYSRVAANADMRAGRPNLAGDPNNAPHTILQWYNTAAFAVPVTAAGSFASLTRGNAARNLVVGPGRALLDLSIRKQFKLSEKIALTYRFEAFNSLNHANFGAAALDLFLTTAGVISSTSTNARQTQMGLRIDF